MVINGPNLARLDIRDSSIYGDLNYAELKSLIETSASSAGMQADVRQSRHTSVISGVATGTIAGFGPNSYVLAINALKSLLG